MDKTNVTIRMTGSLLSDKENFMDIDEKRLVERLIELLKSRKNLVNIGFQSGAPADKKSITTITKIEILLSNENGGFDYYED